MAHMFIRIVGGDSDKIEPCRSFEEKKDCLVIERPDKSVMVLWRKDLISPTCIYLENMNGKTIDRRVYRVEELPDKAEYV